MSKERLRITWKVKRHNITISHVQGGDTFMVNIFKGKKLKDWIPYYSLVGAKKYVAKILNKDYHSLEYIRTNEKV